MATTKIGRVKPADHQNLCNNFLYFFSSADRSGSLGTKSIPQIGQSPGSSLIISGCIGEVYCVFPDAEPASSTKAIPPTRQSPAWATHLATSSALWQYISVFHY